MKTRECPMCEFQMEWQEDDPDVGIFRGWYCPHCDKTIDPDYYYDYYYDDGPE